MDSRYFKKCEEEEADRMKLIAKRKRQKDKQDVGPDLDIVESEGNILQIC